MPISPSAKKALRVSRRKTGFNRHRKALLKTATKQVTIEGLPQAFSLIDRAVKWNLMHKNKAARLKSRLAKTVTAASDTPAKTKSVKKSSVIKAVTPKSAPAKKPAKKPTAKKK